MCTYLEGTTHPTPPSFIPGLSSDRLWPSPSCKAQELTSGCMGDTHVHPEAPSSPGCPLREVGRQGLRTGWLVGEGVPATVGLLQSLFLLNLLGARPPSPAQRREAWCLSPTLAWGSELSRGLRTEHHQCQGVPGCTRDGGTSSPVLVTPGVFIISLSCPTRQARPLPNVEAGFLS